METLADLQSRHRKEQKELQARITQKKKAASKKTRKGVNSECDALEQQLKEKQEQELRALDGDPGDQDGADESDRDGEREGDINGLSSDLKQTSISNSTPADDEEEGDEDDKQQITSTQQQPRKRNRQKERLARRAAETEAAVEAAKAEAANQPDQRAVEHERIHREVTREGLTEKLIRPDGHCLFSAVADQLAQIKVPLGEEGEEGYRVVRKAAAEYIEGHPDDFVAWMEEPLEQYVSKIRDTAEWGGHLELLALARTYKVEICVIQDGARQNIEPEAADHAEGEEKKRIWLAYYRHGFGLGEHYNSLRKAA